MLRQALSVVCLAFLPALATTAPKNMLIHGRAPVGAFGIDTLEHVESAVKLGMTLRACRNMWVLLLRRHRIRARPDGRQVPRLKSDPSHRRAARSRKSFFSGSTNNGSAMMLSLSCPEACHWNRLGYPNVIVRLSAT